MAADPLQEQAARAVLDFLVEGSFPEDENVISSDFDTECCNRSLRLIQAEKTKAESELSVLSHNSIFEVDGWIKQAKQLQEDIERSRNTARNIVNEHETGKKLRARVHDASCKVELLRKEIALNEAVTHEFEHARSLRDRAAQLDGEIADGDVQASLRDLNELKRDCQRSQLSSHSSFSKVLREMVSSLEKKLLSTVISEWNGLVKISMAEHTLSISGEPETLRSLNSALNELGGSSEVTEQLQQFVFQILQETFATDDDSSHIISFEADRVQSSQQRESIGFPSKIDSVQTFLRFIHTRLPDDISAAILSASTTLLISTLIPNALSYSLSDDVLGMKTFQQYVDHAHNFVEQLRDLNCSGHNDLKEWSNKIPRLWLEQRRGFTLDQLRNDLWIGVKEAPKTVDLIETRRARENTPDQNLNTEEIDDWAVNWEVEETSQAHVSARPSKKGNIEDKSSTHDDDNQDGAWDWGDDTLETDTSNPQKAQPLPEKSTEDVVLNAENTLGDVLALKEHYTITPIPDMILSLIMKQVADFELLSSEGCSDLQIQQCGPGLLALPTLILALYRAIAPSIYLPSLASGNMYIHNDCKYLAGRLREIVNEHSLPRLEAEAAEVERFGKLCYSSEMQSHRVILTDLLEGAKGFSNCSSQPMMEDCRIAITSVYEHIRSAHAAWQPVLWKSALLQAVASLISTVIEKIIVAVEDLSDISASDSQYLVKLYTQISQLEDLFLPEGTTEAEKESGMVTPRTAVYVSKWLKFQYLINILESSLADIKYLWMEGELSLEYTEDEIIDLLEALFADSEYRRKAISDIKRSARK